MKWKGLLGLFLSIVVLGFLVKVLYADLDQIRDYEWTFNYYYLMLSFLVFCLSPFIVTRMWVVMMKCFHETVVFSGLFNALNLSLVVRYIPGTVWFMASRVTLLKNLGISRLTGTIALFLELALDFLAAAFLFVITLLIGYDLGQVSLSLILFVLFLLVAGLHPRIFNWIIQRAFRLIKKSEINITWGYRELLHLFLLEVVKWLLQGIAFFLLIKSISDIPFSLVIPIIGINAVAWNLSMLAFIFPAGLGVREAISVLFLQSFMPLNVAIIASILLRLLTIFQEAVFAGISLWLARKNLRLLLLRHKPE